MHQFSEEVKHYHFLGTEKVFNQNYSVNNFNQVLSHYLCFLINLNIYVEVMIEDIAKEINPKIEVVTIRAILLFNVNEIITTKV